MSLVATTQWCNFTVRTHTSTTWPRMVVPHGNNIGPGTGDMISFRHQNDWIAPGSLSYRHFFHRTVKSGE